MMEPQTFTAQDEAEMAAFFASEAMDDPMNPVDQPAGEAETGAPANEKLDTRTDYRGVYVNTHKNKDKFKFRAAISQKDQNTGNLFWTNLGYFNCQLVAAMAYNVAALGIYLGKARLNKVNPSECNTGELEEFKRKRALRIQIANVVINSVRASGAELQYVD